MENIREESIALLGDESPATEKNPGKWHAVAATQGYSRGLTGPHTTQSRTTFTLSQWVIFTLVAIDIMVGLYVVRLLRPTDSGMLEVRSQYVGLEELYASGVVNTSHYPPIVNTARFAAQVSRSEPGRVAPEDEHRHLTNFGTLSPPDRHLRVSSEVRMDLTYKIV